MNYSERQLIIYSPQKKERSFSFLDFFVTLFCISVATFCIYLFYLSLTQTLTSDLDPVGTVTIKYNSVQRRMGDRVLWDRVANESPLYPGDIIRVADYSGATLNFSNNQIDLEDNTLIRVTVDRFGNPRIELSGGTMNFTSTEDSEYISFVIDGRIIEAGQGTQFRTTLENGETIINVTEGSAIVTNESGETVEISAGTFTSFKTGQNLGTAQIENTAAAGVSETPRDETEIEPEPEMPAVSQVPPPPLSPPPGLLPSPVNMQPARGYTINASVFKSLRSIDFSWSPVNEANAYIFALYHETAGGRRQIIRTEPLTAANWSLTNFELLDRGTFIWQVEAVNQNSAGIIQRRGIIGESSFIIDVPIPRVQLHDIRNLYDQ